jgi:hypothetical protein
MLSRGGGPLIPDVEGMPVIPMGDGQQSVSADVTMLSASNFGRLLVNSPMSAIVESSAPANHRPLGVDHDLISVVEHQVEEEDLDEVLASSPGPPKPPTKLALKRNASQGSLINHSSAESEHLSGMASSDHRLLRTTSHGITSFDHELMSPSKRFDRDVHNVMLSTAMQGYLLPTSNVKHNVTEKVAQVD